MKHLYTLLALAVLTTSAMGQSTRTVLVEEGTNASCGPCAQQNPGFNALLDNNVDQVVSIKYQWYFPGYDPMHEHNPEEASARLAYYGINGVPTATIDGVIPDVSPSYAGAPGAFTQSMFDDAAAIPGDFDIEVTYELTPNGLSMEATATCTQAASGDLKFRIAVIEEEIQFASAPGSNGETEFFGVMKKFLPGVDGVQMADSYEVGETFTTSQSWSYANVYDVNELAVVVFIQNDNDKSVLQAAKASDAEIQPEVPNDVTGTELAGLSAENCGTTINPVVTIRNNGSETLTSASIDYVINDQSGSVEWTGNLEFFETTEVELGEITFVPETDNTLEITVSEPNGEIDNDTSNDVISSEVELAGSVAGTEIEVHFYTDNYPSESTWEIINSNNEVIASGGPYQAGTEDQWGGGGPDAQTTKVSIVTLPDVEECYSIKVEDEFGDGLQFGVGEGPDDAFGVEIFFEGNSVNFVELGDFGNSITEDAVFSATGTLSNDIETVEYLNVFPNPTMGVLNIESSLQRSVETIITVNDITGKVVYQSDLGNLPEGYFFKKIDLSSLQSGVYLLNMSTDDSFNTMRIVIQ
ncbi:MAG: T9SS type A sorting domain-containing protein [Cryomorphaceae bacterium]